MDELQGNFLEAIGAEEAELVIQNFEECSHQNGMCYWLDTEVMRILGYSSMESFIKVVRKAHASCLSSYEIDPSKDFVSHDHISKNGERGYYKLSRVACFMVAQYADHNKKEVKVIKYMLAQMADAYIEHRDLERLEERKKLSEGEKAMVSSAINHGLSLDRIALFKDEGYRGMYNMRLNKLKTYKGFVAKKGIHLYDFMNPTELAANALRTRLTSDKIEQNNLRGEESLSKAAFDIGRDVRNIVIKHSGVRPEDLKLEDSTIKELKSQGKKTFKNIRKIDSPAKPTKCTREIDED